jgi:hypothetical protein
LEQRYPQVLAGKNDLPQSLQAAIQADGEQIPKEGADRLSTYPQSLLLRLSLSFYKKKEKIIVASNIGAVDMWITFQIGKKTSIQMRSYFVVMHRTGGISFLDILRSTRNFPLHRSLYWL